MSGNDGFSAQDFDLINSPMGGDWSMLGARPMMESSEWMVGAMGALPGSSLMCDPSDLFSTSDGKNSSSSYGLLSLPLSVPLSVPLSSSTTTTTTTTTATTLSYPSSSPSSIPLSPSFSLLSGDFLPPNSPSRFLPPSSLLLTPCLKEEDQTIPLPSVLSLSLPNPFASTLSLSNNTASSLLSSSLPSFSPLSPSTLFADLCQPTPLPAPSSPPPSHPASLPPSSSLPSSSFPSSFSSSSLPPTNFPPSRGRLSKKLTPSSSSHSGPLTLSTPSSSSSSLPSSVSIVSTSRACPKRKRKTIQRKRQEQQARLEALSTHQTDLKEMVKVAAAEVTIARQTLYNVLKTARSGGVGDRASPHLSLGLLGGSPKRM